MDEFCFRVLTADDKKEVRSLLYLYLEEEVSVQCLSFTPEDKALFVETYANVLYQEMSVGAFECSTGKMCGCNLVTNGQSSVLPETYEKHGTVSERMSKLIRFDEVMENSIEEIAAGRTFWLVELVIVDTKHLRKGLGCRLLLRMEDLVRQSNVHLLFAVANSNSSLNMSLKNGFVLVKQILYADYKDPLTGELVFQGVPLPHTGSVLVFKDISCSSNL